MSTIPVLKMQSLNCFGHATLVKTYIVWLCEVMGSKHVTPDWIFSWTKWQSMYRCLVLSWNNGLAEIYAAIWLSEYSTCKRDGACCKSWSRKHIHWSSIVAEANVLYFASADEHETICCFFDFQETRDFPIKNQ